MSQLALKRVGGIAYREAGGPQTSDRSPVLCLHGWPQSSYMWRHLLPALASAGHRVLAPDLPGFGDSSPDPPGTWERHVEAVERFRGGIGLDRVVLVVHDTGGAIGGRHIDVYRTPPASSADGGQYLTAQQIYVIKQPRRP